MDSINLLCNHLLVSESNKKISLKYEVLLERVLPILHREDSCQFSVVSILVDTA